LHLILLVVTVRELGVTAAILLHPLPCSMINPSLCAVVFHCLILSNHCLLLCLSSRFRGTFQLNDFRSPLTGSRNMPLDPLTLSRVLLK
jgi:hypothetical protein